MVSPKRTVKKQPEDRLAQLLATLEARSKLLAFFFGLCFVAVLLALAIWFPNPTPFQYTVFRITLALAAAGVAGVIPGMIRLKIQPGTALLIHAGGALAVFVIVYLLAPAPIGSELPIENAKKEVKTALAGRKEKQIVLIDNNQSGNIQINNYGLTKEQFKAMLKKQLEKLEEKKQNVDAVRGVFFEQQINELQKQLDNVQESYGSQLERLEIADEAVDYQNIVFSSTDNQIEKDSLVYGNVIPRQKPKNTKLKTRVVEVQQKTRDVLSEAVYNTTYYIFGKKVSFRNTKDDSLKLYCNRCQGRLRTTIRCNGKRFTPNAEWEQVYAEEVCLLHDDGRIRFCNELRVPGSVKKNYVCFNDDQTPFVFMPGNEWKLLDGSDKVCAEKIIDSDVINPIEISSLDIDW